MKRAIREVVELSLPVLVARSLEAVGSERREADLTLSDKLMVRFGFAANILIGRFHATC